MSVSSGQTGSTGPDDLANTRWNIKYKADGEDARNYEFRLLPGGRMLNNHPNDKTMDNDAWESIAAAIAGHGAHVACRPAVRPGIDILTMHTRHKVCVSM